MTHSEPKPGERNVPRLALRVEEAALALGIGREFFNENIAPELRIVTLGRVKLVPVKEIERWLDRNAAHVLS